MKKKNLWVILVIIGCMFGVYVIINEAFKDSIATFIRSKELRNAECVADLVDSSFSFSEKIDFLVNETLEPTSPQFAKVITASLTCAKIF